MGQKLTIVHVFTHSSVTRGGAVQGLVLAKKQFKEGHSIFCLFHKPSGAPLDRTLQRGFHFPVFHFDMKNPLSYLRFARLMQDISPDVVHCHRNLALLFAFFSLRWIARAKNPVIVINRGTTYDLPNWIVRYVFRSEELDHIIAVAEAVKRSLVEREGIPSDKVTVIYGSYDEDRFREGVNGEVFRKELMVKPDEYLVACISAVDRRKGLEYLARAVKMINDGGISIKCVVAGRIEDDTYYRFVSKELERLGVSHCFIFLGHREDVPEIIAAADLSVSSSVIGEGLTGALRESLAMRKPVVATAISGNSELIVDGETGWLVPPANPLLLAKAMTEALLNREEAVRRALNGYEMVQKMCSQEIRYKRVIALYQRLLEKRKVLS
ncbi:MAG: glycosyltransferase family 4 protein [Syntrophobacterales bacterium]|nr:glycosyltransferase family 4 protein [Syntrophobacterales bacterium]